MLKISAEKLIVSLRNVKRIKYHTHLVWAIHTQNLSLGLVQRKDGIVQCYFNDASLIAQYKDTDFHCDHCHKNVYRNSITVLENESGERKVVGTSCVKEFTSGLDGNIIAEVREYMRVLD